MKLKPDTQYKLTNGETVGPLTFEGDVAYFIESSVGGKFIGQWTLDGEVDMFMDADQISKYADVFRIVGEAGQ